MLRERRFHRTFRARQPASRPRLRVPLAATTTRRRHAMGPTEPSVARTAPTAPPSRRPASHERARSTGYVASTGSQDRSASTAGSVMATGPPGRLRARRRRRRRCR
ncbi:hypothetical protein BZL30_3928 [Mycobacterium kansasii]|uniref:Uncharacterized protein n=1 Tax=Mycobacterium kansasii TaxID=1768 RepID=A0A1V3X853_MYCKA|nr:hypothetical protein BZL30_3928 [Mycobacterium kansasii]